MPVFGYGCAVFLQSDIVNFQRQGWRAEEILAGLAAVLPKNIFQYVANVPNVAKLGTRFILQGGTQKNLAVVKAETDFIRASFRDSERQPEIVVHAHCAEAGAIGAAVEAMRLWQNGRRTTFIGLDAVGRIAYHQHATKIRVATSARTIACAPLWMFRLVWMSRPAARREDNSPSPVQGAIAGRRAAHDHCHLREGRGRGPGQDARNQSGPGRDQGQLNRNLVDSAAREVWKDASPASVADPIPPTSWRKSIRATYRLMNIVQVCALGSHGC